MALQDAPSIDATGAMPETDDAADANRAPPDAQAMRRALAGGGRGRGRHARALGCDRRARGRRTDGRVRSMFGGLTRAFGGKKEAEAPALAGSQPPEPTIEPAPRSTSTQPLDPKLANRPLEPGSGAPDLNAIMKRVRDERSQPVKHERDRRCASRTSSPPPAAPRRPPPPKPR